MSESGGNCLKYLKRDGTEKSGRATKILKGAGKLGQGVGALKGGRGGPYELCVYLLRNYHKFCKISKNTIFTEHFRATASINKYS